MKLTATLLSLTFMSMSVFAVSLERINDGAYGNGVKDKFTGITWYDQILKSHEFEGTVMGAQLKCQKNGLKLPTQADFESANISGLSYFNMNRGAWDQSVYFWTSTNDSSGNHTYVFSTSSGDATGTVNTKAVFNSYFFKKGEQIPNGMPDAICIKR